MRKKKKNPKRYKAKYPGLTKRFNSRTKHEYIDFDYVDKLTEDEKEWLNNFNEEYLGGNFQHSGKQLHKTKAAKRDCYNRNNARNRCAYSIAKARGKVTDEEGRPDTDLEMMNKESIVTYLKEKIINGEMTPEKELLIQMLINGDISNTEIQELINDPNIENLNEEK